ncbi:helix-loop-helix protein delilah-like [Neocloeon triangulifer]|uniref:helix-loop-helix protein delilah-like n=1 Tax=Neocloeon triangulifer TaxID=2078957 RepID=UPI00286F5241|nr:helix-loop-helix protein delilah-like [Neocloeon triangulifer]
MMASGELLLGLQPLLRLQPPDANNNDSTEQPQKQPEKYSLRPRSLQIRLETELRRRGAPNAPPSTLTRAASPVAAPRSRGAPGGSKHKPPPLSKYRRKTANARERSRMREINCAFETLRQAVPPLPCVGAPVAAPRGCEKLTKITTLRLAMNYIAALTQILSEAPQQQAPPPPPLMDTAPSTLDLLADADPMFDDIMVADAAFDMLLESDGESLHFHSDLSEQSTP